MIKDSRQCKLSEPVQAEIVGILADGASPIMRTMNYGEYSDFRDYYYPFNRDEEERAIVFVSKRDIEHNNKLHAKTERNHLIKRENCIWSYIIFGPCFIHYDKEITQKEKIIIQNTLRFMKGMDFVIHRKKHEKTVWNIL